MTAVTIARESTGQSLTGKYKNDEKCTETLQHIRLRLKIKYSAVKSISLRGAPYKTFLRRAAHPTNISILNPVVVSSVKRSRVLGPESNGRVPVPEGLFVGERVVTEGSFLLRAEWLKLQPSGT